MLSSAKAEPRYNCGQICLPGKSYGEQEEDGEGGAGVNGVNLTWREG